MEKLYEKQSYLKELDTVVTASKIVDDKAYVQFAQTIFFPEEGGQYADTGVIRVGDDEVKLVDGQITKGEIWYEVEKEIPEGSEVSCRLDWELRYMRMQQHTGEHILTGMIHNKYGFVNVGFHLSDTAPVTLDMNGKLSREEVFAMEAAANAAVYANLPVVDSYPSKEELTEITYRSKIEIEGQVRLISIGEEGAPVDVCACCAPHVARTGEVGIIKVVAVQNYKGGTRISILCGKRALDDYNEKMAVADALAKNFSTSIDKIEDCVKKQAEELADLKYRIAVMAEQQLMNEIQTLPDGKHGCMFVEQDINGVTAKNVYNALAARYEGYVGLFIGSDESGYRFQAGSIALDAKELMNQMRPALNAKGGGSSEMAQGKLEAKKAEIEAFFAGLE